jgi:hypothetical protein
MDNIKKIDVDKNINYTNNNKEIDTTSNINTGDKKSSNDMDIIENTESYQNTVNTYSVNDVEEIDLSIFEE